ncbi:hypothetical protein PSTG_01761 [Puccinia striiformis f. sp. tritici PST-78]|uniref:Uncharacterized protein n=2 Tax=Puccinia striiformis f. sp. tritici TaxID=168172 RepID=A0A0L0W0Z1_9BASI|nr:hypothetical protein PSTG_01761 [Puccinia striiformis f. sp. tritici PST-78]
MTSDIGAPTKLLHEALGHMITVELKTGQVYRGKLHNDQVYIRGPMTRLYVVSDMLQNAPMFKRGTGVKGRGIGTARGRATIQRAQAQRGRGGPPGGGGGGGGGMRRQ